MALQGLTSFLVFQVMEFLNGKRFLYVKAMPWMDENQQAGSKVVVQIIEDKTAYLKPGFTNFGEQITVKMRNTSPEAFSQLRPLATEVYIKDVERATVYGDYRNQLSIIGTVAIKEAPPSK